jgi:hypothetical protein
MTSYIPAHARKKADVRDPGADVALKNIGGLFNGHRG